MAEICYFYGRRWDLHSINCKKVILEHRDQKSTILQNYQNRIYRTRMLYTFVDVLAAQKQ